MCRKDSPLLRHYSEEFADKGFAHFAAALSENDLGLVEASVVANGASVAGSRQRDLKSLRSLLATTGSIGSIAARLIGSECQPVRAILFDKSAARNWSLGWHQDRTIAVRERVEAPGFERWTVKDGIIHVEPPFAILESMVTLRIHIDPVDATNAPLLVAPGSHRLGRLIEDQLADVVEECGVQACLAQRGDIWVYATVIVHACNVACPPKRRRVLQIDYSACRLPEPLEWLAL